MKSIFKFIEKNFGLILFLSVVFAFFFPQYFLWGKNHTDKLLMLAIFLGCLKIDFSEVFHLKKNFVKMIFFIFLNIGLLPLLFYFLSSGLNQDTRIAFFLLFAASGATATPLIASFLKLKVLWSTVFVILTSALIPFSIPFLFKVLFGVSVEISFIEMCFFLFKIVFFPSAVAIVFKKFFPKVTQSFFLVSGSLGSFTIALFLGIVVATNQIFLSKNLFLASTFPLLTALIFFFVFKFALGLFMPSQNSQEKWTNSLMFGNMNNGLMILLASRFFSPQTVFVVLLSEIPWILFQPVFQKVVQKFYKE